MILDEQTRVAVQRAAFVADVTDPTAATRLVGELAGLTDADRTAALLKVAEYRIVGRFEEHRATLMARVLADPDLPDPDLLFVELCEELEELRLFLAAPADWLAVRGLLVTPAMISAQQLRLQADADLPLWRLVHGGHPCVRCVRDCLPRETWQRRDALNPNCGPHRHGAR